jgi:hypothetical protein
MKVVRDSPPNCKSAVADFACNLMNTLALNMKCTTNSFLFIKWKLHHRSPSIEQADKVSSTTMSQGGKGQ